MADLRKARRRGPDHPSASVVAGGDRPNPIEVRAWAAAQGIEVAPRGRIPGEVIEKYRAANG
ncbi:MULTISPECIES: histone-like nucleoid-structuring protein Lsr2 [Streptacidiphilus]|uniref:Histone-like nucleoid-structuring protein Lsr2 n=1 Tax=Streptacidiphilus cavernicola TaxID=3342716 RepID=A0ABV6UXH0_9ACTN|nr:histone-like nucleoid-structuring protein Lsr2 [Streptacidiphilus jeojiense]